MHPVQALELLGGVANLGSLVRLTTRRELARAVADGLVLRAGRDSYALPTVGDAIRLAHSSRGVVCLVSAALAHGWEVKQPPALPQICYPKNRLLTSDFKRSVDARWADLDPAEVVDRVTSPSKTLEMCARVLPYDEALAVADSALRHGEFAALTSLRHARGRGAARIRRVVADATPLAANPFESVLRAISADVSGLDFTPQVRIGIHRPDLVDENLRVVAEADSFQWHGGRGALRRDAERYNDLVTEGWLVLRFSWEDVMLEPQRVRQVLESAVARTRRGTKVGPNRRNSA